MSLWYYNKQKNDVQQHVFLVHFSAETDILGHFVVEKILQLTILQKSLAQRSHMQGR